MKRWDREGKHTVGQKEYCAQCDHKLRDQRYYRDWCVCVCGNVKVYVWENFGLYGVNREWIRFLNTPYIHALRREIAVLLNAVNLAIQLLLTVANLCNYRQPQSDRTSISHLNRVRAGGWCGHAPTADMLWLKAWSLNSVWLKRGGKQEEESHFE